MSDVLELLQLADKDPEYFKSVLKDPQRLSAYEITSKELSILKQLNPEMIRLIVETFEQRIKVRPAADTQACTGGTFACSPATPTRRVVE